jgi:tRNA (pseudouridine54-N1)-methyltransferase
MREFIYYSQHARTSGNFDLQNLMKAGRMDIACQIAIMSFFISHHIRPNVKLHLIFNGPPDSPKHLEMFPGENINFADIENRIDISKKDVAGLIKKMLYKYKKGMKNEVAPGYFIEKKGFINIIKEFEEQGKNIFILDKKGEDLREVKTEDLKDSVFILGDQDGIPKEELKKLKNMNIQRVSVGNVMYFASQAMTIVQNELDRRGI